MRKTGLSKKGDDLAGAILGVRVQFCKIQGAAPNVCRKSEKKMKLKRNVPAHLFLYHTCSPFPLQSSQCLRDFTTAVLKYTKFIECPRNLEINLEFVKFRIQSVIRTALDFTVHAAPYVLCLLYRAVRPTTTRSEVSAPAAHEIFFHCHSSI